MKLGKTIVAERESVLTESERMQNREREKKRKIITALIVIMAFGTTALTVVLVMNELVEKSRQAPETPIGVVYEPKAEIINEDGQKVTAKMRQYVGKIERDFYDLGYKVSRAVVPSGMLREVDIYLDGREEYYKCNLDRGTAETAEDAVRMVKYLGEREIKPKYVDVRIEGKAYYL